MKPVYIVVADQARARVFTSEKPFLEMGELETLVNPDGRLHDQDLETDSPGRNSGRAGAASHSYEDTSGTKEHEVQSFAKLVASHVKNALNTNSFDQLIVVAAPSFLGLLRQEFGDQVLKHVTVELDKNLVTHSIEEIRSHLPKSLSRLQ